MSASLTVTGKAGPGETVTAGVFTGIREYTVNPDSGILTMTDSSGRVIQLDISAATTFTTTISGTTYTITIS